MGELKELIEYIELLEAEPFTGWTGGNKKGYLTACTSIKKKAEKLIKKKAEKLIKKKGEKLHKKPPEPPLGRVLREGEVHFCDNCGSTVSRNGFLDIFGEKLCHNKKCPNSN